MEGRTLLGERAPYSLEAEALRDIQALAEQHVENDRKPELRSVLRQIVAITRDALREEQEKDIGENEYV